MKEELLNEFLYETEGTRKLLRAIPDNILDWKPSAQSWTTGQLASHIATIYFWYQGTFKQDVLDMSTLNYDTGDISKMENIISKFEENAKSAEECVRSASDEDLKKTWRMVAGGRDLMPPAPRLQIVRGFLFNHLYHHRGEMIVYLRSNGKKIPGLYGPTAEDSW